MSLVTDDQVKVHREQDLMRLEEHFVAYDEHRVDARMNELLEKREEWGREWIKQGVCTY